MAINSNNSNKKAKLSAKGLDKIFGQGINNLIDEIEGSENLKESALEINISDIRPNPYQPRKIFDENELKELAASIKKHGLIQPIIVKKSIKGYDLIAGERRTKAAKIAGLDKIIAIIVDFDDNKMREVALIENIQRVDLTAIEEALAYKELIELLSITQEQLAERVGKSRSHVANTIRLLSLPQKAQDYVLTKKMSMGHVKPLIVLIQDKKAVDQILDQIIKNNLSVRKVEELVKNYQEGKSTISAKISVNNNNNSKRSVNEYLENKIMRKLGTKVNIDENKFTIKYNGVKDLNRILEILGLLEE